MDSKGIDALFAPWDRPDSPGCAVGLVQNGELVHQRGYGMADLENNHPLTGQSVFYIASVSKQFTAACIVLLTQQGKLALDDDIRLYMPEMPAYDAPITIRHLIHHTSGLRDYLDLMGMAGRDFEGPMSNADGLALLIRQRGLNFPPGQRHLYCNSGYKLMAEIVGRVSGLSLRQYARRHIFAPLGMERTHFDDDNSPTVADRVISYQTNDEDGFTPFKKAFTIVGSGGLLTTVEDLVRWDRNFVDPQVGGPDFLEQMHTCGSLDDGTQLDYACGLTIGQYKGLPTVGHGGGMLGFSTHFLRFPDQGFTAIVLGNLAGLEVGNLSRKCADIHLADHYDLAELAGSYRSEELDVTWEFTVEGGDLLLCGPRPQPEVLQYAGPDQYRLKGTTIDFCRSGDGKVKSAKVDSGRVQGLEFARL